MKHSFKPSIKTLVSEIEKTPHSLHYVKGISSHQWMEFKDELWERVRILFQPKNELPLCVNCNLIETEQVALKLICELYDTLDSDKELASRLSPTYRQNYVAIYNPLKSKMKYIIKRGDLTKGQVERGASNERSRDLNAEIKIVIPPLTGSVTANRGDAIGNAIKIINEWEKRYENTTESIPEPLDPSDSVNLLRKLLEQLEQRNLFFYYGNWNFLKAKLFNDLKLWKWSAIFTDILHIVSQYVGTRRRTLPERFTEVGTRKVHSIFFVYIDRSSLESDISRKQLEALAANSNALFVVFVQD
ncbi:MAG: hypothetical protein ACOYYU_21290 [Chloroflexota bacterium]